MSAPEHNRIRLPALERFRDAVWGNRDIFTERVTRQSDPNPRIVEYLDFHEHRDAVGYICNAMQEEKLLVVQEYRDAMNNLRIDSQIYKKGACIIGQPGIGIWAFSDSNHIIRVPTVAFMHTRGVRTFQTTSPRDDRHKEWTKQTGVKLYFMDLWSTEEIEDLAYKLEKKWGPVPRKLLEFYRMPTLEAAHQREVKDACEMAAREPNIVIQAVTNFSGPLNIRLSAIFFVKPIGKEIIHRNDYSVWVPTRWLLRQFISKYSIYESHAPLPHLSARQQTVRNRRSYILSQSSSSSLFVTSLNVHRDGAFSGVESPSIGNDNTNSTRARVHHTVRVSNYCVVGASCLMVPTEDEMLDEYTSAYGPASEKRIWSGRGKVGD
ncbi:hypothetical protein HD554DRAFT_2327986 [Boletus coccyginus]|nr:hypothetical protein HD554DRAFT_2327986 [Boletus coccyginus]